MKPSETVTKAIELLARDGWCKTHIQDDGGSQFLLGALRYAALGNPWALAHRPASRAVAAYIRQTAELPTLSDISKGGPQP